MIRDAAILLALTLAGATATQLWHPAAPPWYQAEIAAGEDEVTISDIAERWKGDVVWVDARSKDRYDAEHIPGAILINEYDLDTQIFQNLDKLQAAGKPIIVYCDGQKCQASHKIREHLALNVGLPEVWVLTGGWPAWKQR